MKTPSKHARVVLVPALLVALSPSGLCPTAAQIQSPQPTSKGAGPD